MHGNYMMKSLFSSMHSFTQGVILKFVAVDIFSLAFSMINICLSVLKHVTLLLDSWMWHCIFTKDFMQLSINFAAIIPFCQQKMNHCTHFQL